MASPQYSILYSAQVSASASSGGTGDVLIKDATSGLFVRATAAARGSRRSTGIALGPYVPNGTVEIQQFGQVDPATSGLGIGAASWVRVSSTGGLERCTPVVGDDIVGWVETDGTFHSNFGFINASMTNGGAVNGTGFGHYTSGALDPNAKAVDLATIDVTGALPLARVAAPGGDGFLRFSGGAWTSSSTISNPDIATNAGIDGSKVSPNFGSQNVTTSGNLTLTGGSLSTGSTPAAAGAVRLTNATDIRFRNPSNTADTVLATVDSSNYIRFGLSGEPQGYVAHGGGQFGWYSASKYYFLATTNSLQTSVPIVGDGAGSPYSVHGFVAVPFPSDANYTVTAAQYCNRHIYFMNGSWTVARTITLPSPATQALGYYVHITNATNFTITVSTGVGSNKTLATNVSQLFWIDSTGPWFASATWTR
ncbi:hypothetical protein AKJ09_03659 [Labilithrix luteola]|uniref:Uncharacterized protein n=1 Tax=Labilithrix luteola TaxID=1391654 RepID=A0A0K1PTY4_9BACT|nr:hypothetical protein [Labilithrix luteola]AKU96995.1 hypothetical protein AKJ09_03659 [Labilithrix luteola]